MRGRQLEQVVLVPKPRVLYEWQVEIVQRTEEMEIGANHVLALESPEKVDDRLLDILIQTRETCLAIEAVLLERRVVFVSCEESPLPFLERVSLRLGVEANLNGASRLDRLSWFMSACIARFC